MIRVAMVNTVRTQGGAARVAALLAQTFHDHFDDVDVTLYHCEHRERTPPFYGLKRPLSRPLNAFLARLGGSTCVWDMGVAGDIVDKTRNADVLHIHNLHGYYLDYPKLLHAWRDRPVVWTLHDMWSLTGRCGSSSECSSWRLGCPMCPYKKYYPKAWIDNAKREFQLKQYLYSIMNSLTIVTPSNWLSDLALQRGFSREYVHVVPNPVDTTKFGPIDKYKARKELNLPDNAYLALFVASDCGDRRKGYADFAHAVIKSGCLGLAVGKRPPQPAQGVLHTGSVSDQSAINLYYCASDVFIIPSYADNYPNTVIEALISGTPVIGYEEGGIPSQLDLPHCRIVAKGDRQALCDALVNLVAGDGKESSQSRELSEIAQRRWAPQTVADQYRNIYRKQCNPKN